MTAHKAEYADLRVGCRVTLRDWRGDSINGTAFLSPTGAWLARCTSGAVFPITPRELIAVENGAAEMYARLRAGARVRLAAWDGTVTVGVAGCSLNGTWLCKAADGARWLIEPHALMSVETEG